MTPAVLTLAAFSVFPGTFPSGSLEPGATAVQWTDTWILSSPEVTGLHVGVDEDILSPEASASDEVSQDLIEDADPVPNIVLVGCELALSGHYTPETWAREVWVGAPWPIVTENGHTEKDGRWVAYEQIGRRPERPESYAAYRTPVADAPVVSGYDLDKPDAEQRRGRMHAVGHGGLDLVAPMGTPITMVRLDHQVGDAEVLYVGPLYGQTVVTRHVVREGGADHDYLLIFGHMDHEADDVRRGRRLREGATVGYVGNTDSPELVHLHLEARRMHDGVDAWRLPPDALHAREYSVVTDPRNVLPLRVTPPRAARCAPRLAPVTRRYWLGDSLALTLE